MAKGVSQIVCFGFQKKKQTAVWAPVLSTMNLPNPVSVFAETLFRGRNEQKQDFGQKQVSACNFHQKVVLITKTSL